IPSLFPYTTLLPISIGEPLVGLELHAHRGRPLRARVGPAALARVGLGALALARLARLRPGQDELRQLARAPLGRELERVALAVAEQLDVVLVVEQHPPDDDARAPQVDGAAGRDVRDDAEPAAVGADARGEAGRRGAGGGRARLALAGLAVVLAERPAVAILEQIVRIDAEVAAVLPGARGGGGVRAGGWGRVDEQADVGGGGRGPIAVPGAERAGDVRRARLPAVALVVQDRAEARAGGTVHVRRLARRRAAVRGGALARRAGVLAAGHDVVAPDRREQRLVGPGGEALPARAEGAGAVDREDVADDLLAHRAQEPEIAHHPAPLRLER